MAVGGVTKRDAAHVSAKEMVRRPRLDKLMSDLRALERWAGEVDVLAANIESRLFGSPPSEPEADCAATIPAPPDTVFHVAEQTVADAAEKLRSAHVVLERIWSEIPESKDLWGGPMESEP